MSTLSNSPGWCPFAEVIPAYKGTGTLGNYWKGREGHKVVAGVNHIVVGSLQSAISTFQSPASGVSAHFVIGRTGRIVQMVSLLDTSYANGISPLADGSWLSPEGHVVHPPWDGLQPGVNPIFTTYSVEHEGYPGDAWTQAMIDADAKVHGWCGQQLDLTFVPGHTLIGHRDISPVDRPNCPGPNYDFARQAALANQIMGKAPTPVPATSLTFVAPARISYDTFAQVLTAAKSPAAPFAYNLYQTAIRDGVEPAVALAFFAHESTYGTRGRAVQNISWGNVRAPYDPSLAIGVDADGFARYSSWVNSLDDWCRRILGRYVARGLDTVDKALPVYAPAGPPDYNQPTAYLQAVIHLIGSWEALPPPPPQYPIYRCTVLAANIRQAPTTQSPVALNGTAIMRLGDTAMFDTETPGQNTLGSSVWRHRADGIGFVHSALLAKVGT